MVFKNQIYRFLLLAAMAVFTSCAHLVHLDRAQNNFNRGAELENQLSFNPKPDVSASPSMYYSLAYAELDKALANKNSLSSDHVLATTYTIKALCEWKLAMYDEAKKSADNALDELEKMEKTGMRLPRDKALMEALPALMEIGRMKEELYAFHSSAPSFEASKAHYLEFIYNPDSTKMARLEAAIEKVANVQATVATNEELSAYFVMSQLAGLKTWSDAHNFLLTCIDENDTTLSEQGKDDAWEWKGRQESAFENFVKEKKPVRKLRRLMRNEQGRELAQWWSARLGVTEDEDE